MKWDSKLLDFQLRPLFNYFKARTLTTGVFATPQDFAGDMPVSSIEQRIDTAIAELAPWLRDIKQETSAVA